MKLKYGEKLKKVNKVISKIVSEVLHYWTDMWQHEICMFDIKINNQKNNNSDIK